MRNEENRYINVQLTVRDAKRIQLALSQHADRLIGGERYANSTEEEKERLREVEREIYELMDAFV